MEYAKTNDGASRENTVTIVNRFDFELPRARLRFLMPKGTFYAVSKGTIEQQFGGDLVHVVDVRVPVDANSMISIEIKVP